MDRRTVLKGGLALAVTAHTAVASGDDTASMLTKLIDRHKTALAADESAWHIVSDITEVLETNGHEAPKVQIGVYHVMDGTKPMYGRSEEEIRAHSEKHMNGQLSMLQHPNRAADYAAVKARFEQRCEASIAELKRLESEYRHREDESGYTAAMDKAKAAMAVVRSLEQEIVAFVPTSLPEAAQKATWCAWAARHDFCYLNDSDNPEDVLIEALAAIGRALS